MEELGYFAPLAGVILLIYRRAVFNFLAAAQRILKAPLCYARKMHHRLFLASKGYGIAIETDIVDEQYRAGFYSFLDSTDELANYMVMIGYIQHFSKLKTDALRFLDLGCGHGRLLELLRPYPRALYVGLDKSVEGLKLAAAQNFENTEFVAADFEDYQPSQKFDFIVSSGSIHYAPDAAALLRRLRSCLTDDGVFIVSLWRYGQNAAIWRKLEEEFEILDAAVVTNKKGVSWDVKVFR